MTPFGDARASCQRLVSAREVAGPVPGVEHAGRLFSAIVSAARGLACHLEITLLRHQRPGGIIHGGDLDYSLKLIFDACASPNMTNETRAAVPVRFRKGHHS